MSDKKPVILTGLRTNAEYHLGNYLGAIKPMVELQQKHAGEYQVNMFAPDLHSFTTEVEHDKLYQQTHDNLKVFIAAGMPVENEDFFMYRQSRIPAHSELTVILNNFAYFGELSRMTQFKEKAGKHVVPELTDQEKTLIKRLSTIASNTSGRGEFESVDAHATIRAIQDRTIFVDDKTVPVGLFDYPVLMAADILLYGAKYVPVGEDQRQHLELTRDIAIRLNNKFGELFVVPEPWDKQLEFSGQSEGVRIRSLRRPEAKMSKSVDDPAGTIVLSDSPDEAKKKVMEATTDNEGKISWNWGKQPGVTNLLQILALLSGRSKDEVMGEWQDKDRYGDLKNAVAEAVASFLSDFQAKRGGVNDEALEQKLQSSETAMSEVANATLERVQQAVGLRQ